MSWTDMTPFDVQTTTTILSTTQVSSTDRGSGLTDIALYSIIIVAAVVVIVTVAVLTWHFTKQCKGVRKSETLKHSMKSNRINPDSKIASEKTTKRTRSLRRSLTEKEENNLRDVAQEKQKYSKEEKKKKHSTKNKKHSKTSNSEDVETGKIESSNDELPNSTPGPSTKVQVQNK